MYIITLCEMEVIVVKISVEQMLIEQKTVLVQLMELYMYDFSLYSDDDGFC